MENGSMFHSTLTVGDYSPRVAAYYFKQWTEFRMPFHRHDATEIMYVIDGRCQVDIQQDAEANTTVYLKKGEFILLDANVEHRLIVERESCRMLNIEFRFADRKGTFPSIRELAAEDGSLASMLASPCPYVVLRDPEEVYHTLKSLVLELDSRGADNGTMVRLLFPQLLIRIARLLHETDRRSMPQAEYYVKQCLAFLHQNYDRDIQVKAIASFVNLHPGYLHRIFKAHTGRTIMEYLTSLRMEKAKMLLLQTDIPVIEISDYVGVGSRQYFHFLFKKHTNCTPQEFRRSMEKQVLNYGRK